MKIKELLFEPREIPNIVGTKLYKMCHPETQKKILKLENV